MASTISSTNTSLPPSWPSERNSTTLGDVSFSSYLDSSEETYIQTLKHQQCEPVYNTRQKKVEDGEIDVFSADKYFNGGGLDHQEHNTRSAKHQQRISNDHIDHKVSVSRLNLQPRTPSIHSESSWNSQSVLLRRVQRTPSRGNRSSSAHSQQKKSSFLSSCICCVKKSVDIEPQVVSNHSNQRMNNNVQGHERVVPRAIKTDYDAAELARLSKLRLDADPLATAKKIQLDDQEEQEVKRKKSLEVFGSSEVDEDESKRFNNIEKRLNMLAWDAIPRSVDEINTSGPPSETYKDTESDASSDLFEIECLSCTANPVVQGPRHTSCDGSATPTTGYAPSEVSVDWSVVTASAADYSIAPEFDDQRSVLTSVSRNRMPRKPASSANMTVSKEVQKPRSPLLLAGCKSQKSVRVALDNYRSLGKAKLDHNTQRMHRFSDSSLTPVTRFQAEAKQPGFGLKQTKTISSSDLLFI